MMKSIKDAGEEYGPLLSLHLSCVILYIQKLGHSYLRRIVGGKIVKAMQAIFTVCTFFLFNSFTLGSEIEAAIENRNELTSNARNDLIAGYQGVIQKAIEKGNIERSTQLRRYLEYFKEEDALYLVPGMKPFILDYLKSIRSAGASLREEYVKEIKIANEAMNFDLAEQLALELTDHRIPEKTVSFKLSSRNEFLYHFGFRLYSKYSGGDSRRFHATWEKVPGLFDTAFVSIRPINWPNRYIGHLGFRLRLTSYKDDATWKKHATWERTPGLSNSKTGVSFRALTHPDRYIRVRDNGEVWLDKYENNSKFKSEATFFVRNGLFDVR